MARKFRLVPRQNFKRTQVGKTIQAYAFPGSYLRRRGASFPKHGVGVQGSTPQPGYQRAAFANGLDAFTIDVTTNASIVADTTDLKINGKVVALFGTGDGKIAIGANATETETNIKDFLDGLKGFAPKPLTAVIDTGKVLVKGTGREHVKDPMTITTTTPGAITIANVTSTLGVAPSWVVQAEGSPLIPGTSAQFDFPLDVKDDDQTVSVISIAPEDTDDAPLTLAVLVAGWKAALDAALDGTGIAEADGFIHSNKLSNYAAIKDGMRAVFGDTAATAFVISGDDSNILTINHGTKGTAGNAMYADFFLNASIPQILYDLYLGENDEPIIDEIGPGIPLGSIQGVNSNDTNSTAVVPQDSGRNDYGTGISGSASELSLTFNDLYDPFNQRLGLGTAATAKTGQRDLLMPGGRPGAEVWGIVLVIDSHLESIKNLEIIIEVQFTDGLAAELTKASVKGGQIKGTILADGSASPTKIRAIARQLKQI